MLGKVRIIGVPMDLGQDRRGVDMGPSALRVANLNARLRALGYTVEDMGNVAVRVPEEMPMGEKRAKYLPEIAETCKELAQVVAKTLDEGWTPLLLGGDHSLALGYGPTELTKIFGYAPKVAAENSSLVGVRNLDSKEKRVIRDAGIRVFTMRDLDERGMRAVMEEALGRATDGTAGFACSLDMDFCDPSVAPGVGTPERGGVTYREAHLAMEMIADSGKLLSLEVVEINPVIDEHNRTAQFGVELVLSALGKKIL